MWQYCVKVRCLVNVFCFQSAVHVRPAWEGYVLEGLVVAGMVLYLSNYLIGRSKNGALAYTWWVSVHTWSFLVLDCMPYSHPIRLEAHSELLASNFTLVGKERIL